MLRASTRRGRKRARRQSITTAGIAAHPESGWLKSKGPVLKFLVAVCFLMGLFYLVYIPFTQTGLFDFYLETLASVSGATLSVSGQDIDVTGQAIVSDSFSLRMVAGCDGLEAIALFAAAVLGSPVAWRRRLWFLLVGVPIFAAINLLRIVSLFYVGVYRPHLLDRIHMEVWPGVLIILVVSCWLVWARWAWQREGAAS